MISITKQLAKNMLEEQFPQFKDLEITDIKIGGWDNKVFRLGDDKLIKMPIAKKYEIQIDTTFHWLPKLANHLPFKIPQPLGRGKPSPAYPFKWAIYNWIEGDTVFESKNIDGEKFADDLVTFIKDLHKINIDNAPAPSIHNFYRGGDLRIYDTEIIASISALKGKIDYRKAMQIWEKSIASQYHDSPLWIHGDLSLGNILLEEGQIKAIIDFGMIAAGDPACDLAVAYNIFTADVREEFIIKMDMKKDVWDRAKGWALWKSLISFANPKATNVVEATRAKFVLKELGVI